MEYGVVWAADWIWALWTRGTFLAAVGDTDIALWTRGTFLAAVGDTDMAKKIVIVMIEIWRSQVRALSYDSK
jgi:hypothetical protein